MKDGDIFQNGARSGKRLCFNRKDFSGLAYMRELS